MPKKKDATVDEGVSAEVQAQETETKTERAGTGHADAMEAIAGYVSEQHIESIKEAGGVVEEEEPEPEEPEKKETPEETKETPEPEKKETTAEPEEEPPTEETVKLVVDGEEKEVPLSQVVDAGTRTLQKESAADKRLEEATKLLKEAKVTVRAQPPQTEDVDPEKTETIEEEVQPDFDAVQKKLANAIQYGEDDAVEVAISEFRKAISDAPKPKGTTVDEAEITANVIAEVEGKQIMDKFHLPKDEGGFKDLADDLRARALVGAEIDKMLKDGEPNSWGTYQKAGEEIRKFLGWEKEPTPEPEPEPEPDPKLTERIEKKREIDTIQPATAVTETTLKPETPEEVSETIDNMRKSRVGQTI